MMSTLSSRVPPKQARLVMTELRTRMRPSINGYLCVSYEEEDTCVSPFEEEDTCVTRMRPSINGYLCIYN